MFSGDYPVDRKEKPVAFPDPAEAAVRSELFALLPLERVIELKVASDLTAPHRLRDLADVIELIRVNELTEGLAQDLTPTSGRSTGSCGEPPVRTAGHVGNS